MSVAMRPTCLLTIVLLSGTACTGSGPVPARGDPAPTKDAAANATPTAKVTAPTEAVATRPTIDEPPPGNVAATGAPPEPAAEPAQPGLPSVLDPPVEPAIAPATEPAIAPATAPAEVPVQAVAPSRTTVTWREVARPAEPLTFVPLIRGVLAKSASGYSDVDAGGVLVLRPEIEAPTAPVLGVWPDNAWFIETRIKIDIHDRAESQIRQIRLMRLRGKRRWVPQTYNGEQRFEDDGERFQIGGTGGLIVESHGTLTRLADNAIDPTMGQDVGGELVAFFETKSGKVYPVRRKDEALHVQSYCEDPGCVALQAVKLPLGTQWAFTQPVTRQQHSISAVATVRTGEQDLPHLLHYEAGGWKLESIAAAPAGLWPTRDGGLWTIVGAQLLHRDPAGGWREVALPDGATSPTAAMGGDFKELWIAATVADMTVVFGTAANAQSPPPAPGTPAP
jgi:hypothetical protein